LAPVSPGSHEDFREISVTYTTALRSLVIGDVGAVEEGIRTAGDLLTRSCVSRTLETCATPIHQTIRRSPQHCRIGRAVGLTAILPEER
jgi:hypothetical protein